MSLITPIGEEVLLSISSELKDASCLAVIADETTDKSIKSQLSVVVRYLNGDTLTERCIGMIYPSNLKGKALADANLSHLKSLNLLLEKWLIKAMIKRVLYPEKIKTFKRLQEFLQLAVYLHCLARIEFSFKIHSKFDFIGDIACFFFKSSSRRKTRLTTAIKSMSD